MPETVGWQPGPIERGTSALINSCLITIFACTWTLLHLNVPGLRDGVFTKVIRKAKWMAITILLPEFIFAKAICDLRLALNDLREFDDGLQKRCNGKLQWTVVHDNYKHEYSWQVDFGSGAGFLYRMLGLQPPPADRATPVERLAEREDEDPTGSSASTEKKVTYHTAQNWTLTHAYFANMGGLLCPGTSDLPHDRLKYYVIPSTQHGYQLDNWATDHPLKGLILKKEDIEDKCKVDFLVKCLTALQIAWIVVTIHARSHVGLPVSQLEIATMAFSVFAAATYMANLWKPKDVSMPILLPKSAPCDDNEVSRPRVQNFLLRLIYLTDEIYCDNEKYRVENDIIWVEGGVPLIFSIMAVSALLFGCLHSLAWNFDFPSRAEQTLWRVTCLTSTILPVTSLGLNLYIDSRATKARKALMSCLISSLLERLEPLRAFPDGLRESLMEPPFQSWAWHEKYALFSTPTGARKFDKEPPKTPQERSEGDPPGERRSIYDNINNLHVALRNINSFLTRASEGAPDAELVLDLKIAFGFLKRAAYEEVLDFWDEFEGHLWSESEAYQTSTSSSTSTPRTKYVRHVLKTGKLFMEEEARFKPQRDAYNAASRFIILSSIIIYIASRMIIMVLLFTSLRAIPQGVYRLTPWTEFLPGFS
ncbi:hypothetical protein F5B17DRAFT_424683 [Nemania serpens]|nr:hypothetical protein F5B17DRAFT_424683 [Nemania serpens]